MCVSVIKIRRGWQLGDLGILGLRDAMRRYLDALELTELGWRVTRKTLVPTVSHRLFARTS